MKRFKKFVAGIATLLMLTVQVPTDIAQMVNQTTNIATHTLAPQLSPNMNLSPTAAQPVYGTTAATSWNSQVKSLLEPFKAFAKASHNPMGWKYKCYLVLFAQYDRDGSIRSVRIDKTQRELFTRKNLKAFPQVTPENDYLNKLISPAMAQGLDFDLYFDAPDGTSINSFIFKIKSSEHTTPRYIKIESNNGKPKQVELDEAGFKAALKEAKLKSIDESSGKIAGAYKTKLSRRQAIKQGFKKLTSYVSSPKNIAFAASLLCADVLIVSAIGCFTSIAGGVTSLIAIGAIIFVGVYVTVALLSPRGEKGARLMSVLIVMLFLLSACTTMTGATSAIDTSSAANAGNAGTTITTPVDQTTEQPAVELPAEFETQMTINFASADLFEEATPFSHLTFWAAGQQNYTLDFSQESEYKIRIEFASQPSTPFTVNILSGHLTYPDLRDGEMVGLGAGNRPIIGGERFSHSVNCLPHLFEKGSNGKYYLDIDLTEYPELGGSFYGVEFNANTSGELVFDNNQTFGSLTPTLYVPETDANIADIADEFFYAHRDISSQNPDYTTTEDDTTLYGYYFTNNEDFAYYQNGETPASLTIITQNKPSSNVDFTIGSSQLQARYNQNEEDWEFNYETGETVFGVSYVNKDFSVAPRNFQQREDGTWAATVTVRFDDINNAGLYRLITPETNIIGYDLDTAGSTNRIEAQKPLTGAEAVRVLSGDLSMHWDQPISSSNPGIGFAANRPDLGLETQSEEGIANTVEYYRSQGLNLSSLQSTFVWHDGTTLSLENTHADFLWNNYGIPMYLRLETRHPDDPGDRGFLVGIEQGSSKSENEFRAFCREAKDQGIPIYLAFDPQMNYTGQGFERFPWQGDPNLYRGALSNLHDIAVEEGANNIIFVLDVHADHNNSFPIRSYYDANIIDMITLRANMETPGGYGSPNAMGLQYDGALGSIWDELDAIAPNIPVNIHFYLPNEDIAYQEFIIASLNTPMRQRYDAVSFTFEDSGKFALKPETVDTLKAFNFSDDFSQLLEDVTNQTWDVPNSVAEIVLPEYLNLSLREVTPGAKVYFSSLANMAKANAVDENIEVLIQALIIQSGLGIYDESNAEVYDLMNSLIKNGTYHISNVDTAIVMETLQNRGFYGLDPISTSTIASINAALSEVETIDPDGLAEFDGIDRDSQIWQLLTARDEHDVMQILYTNYTAAFDDGRSFLGLNTTTKVSFDTFQQYALPYAQNIVHNLTLLRAVYQFPLAQEAGVALSYQADDINMAS